MSNKLTVRDYFNKDGVKAKFAELLGQRATGFITSVMQVVNGNNYLQKAKPESIYAAAAMAATLDLPINNNLGFAWIVPYGNEAQFQMGWKGFVQLAQRTGQYKRINVIEVHENQFKSYNELTEDLDADFSTEGNGKIIGYVAYFQLINGFEKLSYWTIAKVKAHGTKFSKTFDQKSGSWNTNFDAMAKKTVLKNTLSKWGILSIEMQRAIISDQSVIKDVDTTDVEHVDVTEEEVEAKPEFTELNFEQAYEAGAEIETIRLGYSTTPEIEQQYNDYVNQKNAGK